MTCVYRELHHQKCTGFVACVVLTDPLLIELGLNRFKQLAIEDRGLLAGEYLASVLHLLFKPILGEPNVLLREGSASESPRCIVSNSANSSAVWTSARLRRPTTMLNPMRLHYVLFALPNRHITPDGRRDLVQAASAIGSLNERQNLIWVWFLSFTPLSRAYPFVALAFVLTPLLAVSLFGETFRIGLMEL
jgi:hypothetical protein